MRQNGSSRTPLPSMANTKFCGTYPAADPRKNGKAGMCVMPAAMLVNKLLPTGSERTMKVMANGDRAMKPSIPASLAPNLEWMKSLPRKRA